MTQPADVIILAAGSGKRMGAGVNKMFLAVKGVPVIYRTLDRFNRSPQIRHIYLVCKTDEQDELEKVIQEYGTIGKLKAIIPGGKERADSVKNALRFYLESKASGIIMIHDGARPFVSSELIDSLLEKVPHDGISIPVLKVFETTRKKEGHKTEVVNRDNLYLTQTPQVFYSDQISDCYFSSSQSNHPFTDDASFFEALGKRVHFVEGEKWNVKLTVSNDIQWAEAILNQFQFLDIQN